MLPNMKFYIASIVSIFTALAVGIYIGFSLDTQEFVTDQQQNLIEIVESQFETITDENKELVNKNESLSLDNRSKEKFISESYDYIISNRLDGKKIALIETSEDYIISSIIHDLKNSGAKVSSLTRVKDLSKEEVVKMTDAIIAGSEEELEILKNENKIEGLGIYNEEVDLIIIGGGSISEESSKVISIDREIINRAKKNDVEVVGVEKSYAKNSYMNKYKEYGIASVDNVDMKMGKIALILTINDGKGHYGIKGTSESILPVYKSVE